MGILATTIADSLKKRKDLLVRNRLEQVRSNALHAFEEWLHANSWLFEDSADQKKQEKKQRELRKIQKTIEDLRSSPSLSALLGFALWCQNYVANFGGLMFGMGIYGDPVKCFHITDPRTDSASSERLA